MKKLALIKTILLTISLVFICALVSYAAGWVDDGGDNWMYIDKDGYYITNTIKTSGNDKFYLDENGMMVRDYLLEDYNDSIYYFDDSGKMVINTWVAVEPTQVYNQMDNPPTIYLYYFGSNGKAYRAKDGISRKTIDGKKYLFNEYGQMLSGWINDEGERWNEYESDLDPFDGFCYYAGDETDGVLREGWSAYEDGSVDDRYYMKTTLWFFFKSNDNRKVQADNEGDLKKRTINGKSYAFDDRGVMVMGWDSDLLDTDNSDNSIIAKKYYMEEGKSSDIGRNTKREWFFAVPAMKQNLDDHDQEVSRWFYANGSGEIVKNIVKKINTDYYVFNDKGIMKSGLCVISKGTRAYVDCIDEERTDGKDFIISRHYVSTDKTSNSKEFEIFDSDTQYICYFNDDETEKNDFGKRKVGSATIPFGDDDYTFSGQRNGEEEGWKKKKYYQAGIQLKPDPAVDMGVVLVGYSRSETGETIDEPLVYNGSTNPWANPDKNHGGIMSDYMVTENYKKCYDDHGVVPAYAAVTGNGTRLFKSNRVKKDRNGRYWLIGNNGMLVNIYEVPIRYNKREGWQFQSESGLNSKSRVKTQWINFGTKDEYDKTCKYSKTDPGEYALILDDTYCLNFRFAD